MKKTKIRAKLLLLLLILCISVGYAVLQSDLTINGTAGINNPTWDIHWENVSVTAGSVTGTNVTTPATIDSSKTTVNYNIKLPKPGDFYEFTVDAVNDGTIDAMIDTIDSKLNGTTITSLPSYLKYSVTYSDGSSLQANQELKADTSETYKVRIEFKKDIDNSQLPSTVQSLNLSFSVVYKQATDDAQEVDHSTIVYTSSLGDGSPWGPSKFIYIGFEIPSYIPQYSSPTEAIEALSRESGEVTGNEYVFYCLKHKIKNGLVVENDVVFIITPEMVNDRPEMTAGTYTLLGGAAYDDFMDSSTCKEEYYNSSTGECLSQYYESNKATLIQAIGNSKCTEYPSVNFDCRGYAASMNVYADASPKGYVSADNGSTICSVTEDGTAICTVAT